MIDLYCERLGPGLLAEPANALSNVFFIIAGMLSWHTARRLGYRDGALLSALLVAIGCGSALFHTFASAWAQWLDVLPIAAFQLTYLGLYLCRVNRLPPSLVGGALMTFSAAMAAAVQFDALVNGSLAYAPALLALVLLAVEQSSRRAGSTLAFAALLFGCSLVARSLDLQLCQWWPLGTHFIWHCLNALVLYLALDAYIDRRPPCQPS